MYIYLFIYTYIEVSSHMFIQIYDIFSLFKFYLETNIRKFMCVCIYIYIYMYIYIYIYVTAILCNQSFREMPKKFSHFMKRPWGSVTSLND